MKDIKADEIFTPGSLPKYTYNDREQLNLERRLLDAVTTRGFICSVSGPSKSGKTVLCESVIGQGRMLLVAGGGVSEEKYFGRKSVTGCNYLHLHRFLNKLPVLLNL